MGSIGQRTDLFRILLADDDDVHAFTVQCTVNRLSRASAFVRVSNREVLGQKIRMFEPELLLLCGGFAASEELAQIKPFTNGSPIVCLAQTVADAEASLAAGASDCLLVSQEAELGECLEKHLSGIGFEPHFRSAVAVEKVSRFSAAEAKLEELDRRIASWFREVRKRVRHKWQKLQHATRLGCETSRVWTARKYRDAKIKHLLRKQQRLVEKSVPTDPRLPATGRILEPVVPPTEATPSHRERIDFVDDFQNPPKTEETNSDALRTLELSFKTLFHSSLDAVFLVDGFGSILHVNPAACGLLGIVASDLLGQNLFSFIPESEKARSSTMWEAMLVEGQQKAELVIERAGGEQREVYVSARANLWFGIHLAILRDETELKQLRHKSSATGDRLPLGHHTSTGPLGTGMAARCADAGSMKDETSGAGR